MIKIENKNKHKHGRKQVCMDLTIWDLKICNITNFIQMSILIGQNRLI